MNRPPGRRRAVGVAALIGAGALVAGALVAVPAGSALAATGCDVTYQTNTWPGGFTATVNIRNLGDPITGWTLRFAFPNAGQSVGQGWSATWAQTGTQVTATSMSYNGALDTGASTSIGFNGTWSGGNPAPSSFTVNGALCTGAAPAPSPSSPAPPPPPPGNGDCAVAPVDPQATRQARNLLCYLYSQYGNHIISGQQESTWVSGPDYEMNYVRAASGKLPAIRGQDMGDSPDFGARGLAWWNAGGIPMVGYHMGAPNQGVDGYTGSRMRANINAALTPGTSDNATLNQRLTNWANQLKIIQTGGGAVIMRPWHEASGTWFWWSMEGAAQYNRLWIYTFNFMLGQGVHNLVWLHPFNDFPSSAWYPGRQYADIGGADHYASSADHGPMTSMFTAARSVYGGVMPIALHENGPMPDPAQLQATGTRWVLFNTWHTSLLTANPNSIINAVYNHPYVVTRDELPNLR